jgi:outer membrane protein assembly factor BamB
MRINSSLAVVISVSCAMAWGADWPTDGGNPQRTAWQKDEKILTTGNVKDLKCLWKIKLDNQPREMHSLFPPLIAGRVSTSTGEKQIAIVAGISDNIYAIDVEAGTLLWTKHFSYTSTKPLGGRPGTLCPGGLTATPVIGPPNPANARTIYTISWDGMLHQLNAGDGEDVSPPVTFVPANGKPYALNLWDNVLYTTTAQGCGGNSNMVYALDLSSPDKKVTSFNPGGNGGLWGRTGAAIGSDGTVYAPTGDGPFDPAQHMLSESLIAVTPKNLQLKDYYSPSNAAFMWKRDLDMNVTPAVFDYKGRDLVVTSSKECRVFLLDSKSLGGADHRTPLYRTPLMCNEEVNFAAAGVWGSLASWEDSKGTRWVLVPFWGPVHSNFKVPVSYGPVTHGAVMAFKVEEQNGKAVLTPVWMSRDMDQAEPPVIANGVVFAYGNGENSVQATPELGLGANKSEIRIKNSTHAVLYALDAETGKELWSSGNEITSFAHFTGLSVANGRLYLGTYDGTLYSFGLAGH